MEAGNFVGHQVPQDRRPEQEASPGRRKRRHQVSIACVVCAKAKAACTDTRPCKRCIRLGKEEQCVDSADVRAQWWIQKSRGDVGELPNSTKKSRAVCSALYFQGSNLLQSCHFQLPKNVACLACNKAKARCDGCRPCARCRDKKIECVNLTKQTRAQGEPGSPAALQQPETEESAFGDVAGGRAIDIFEEIANATRDPQVGAAMSFQASSSLHSNTGQFKQEPVEHVQYPREECLHEPRTRGLAASSSTFPMDIFNPDELSFLSPANYRDAVESRIPEPARAVLQEPVYHRPPPHAAHPMYQTVIMSGTSRADTMFASRAPSYPSSTPAAAKPAHGSFPPSGSQQSAVYVPSSRSRRQWEQEQQMLEQGVAAEPVCI